MQANKNMHKWAVENILTSIEVSNILGITKQRVAAIVKDSKLKPFKKTSAGMLFLKDDVLRYESIRNQIKDLKKQLL